MSLNFYLDPIKLDNWQIAKDSLSPICAEPVVTGLAAHHLCYFSQPINANQLTAAVDVGKTTGSVSSLMAWQVRDSLTLRMYTKGKGSTVPSDAQAREKWVNNAYYAIWLFVKSV